MMASLYHSSSAWPALFGTSVVSIDDMTFMARASCEATEQQRGVAHRVDPDMQPAPFHRAAFAGDQVLDRGDMLALAAGVDLDVADRKPEFVRIARQRNGADHGVGAVHRFLDKGDDVAVIHAEEAQVGGLPKRGIGPPRAVELADVRLDVARLVPVAPLDLVFFGI